VDKRVVFLGIFRVIELNNDVFTQEVLKISCLLFMALLIILIRAEILDIGGTSPSHSNKEKSILNILDIIACPRSEYVENALIKIYTKAFLLLVL